MLDPRRRVGGWQGTLEVLVLFLGVHGIQKHLFLDSVVNADLDLASFA